jgi:hypothetical protein
MWGFIDLNNEEIIRYQFKEEVSLISYICRKVYSDFT